MNPPPPISKSDHHVMMQTMKDHYLPESSSPIGYSPSQTLYTPSPNVTRPSSPSKLLPYTRPNSPSSKPSVQVVERHPQPWSKVHWTRDWSWVMYTVNLGTGAVSLCVSSIPYPFRGQHAIGSLFLILNIIIMAFNMSMSTLRLVRHPKAFRDSFYDEVEGIWFPVLPIAWSSILIGIIIYGIPYCGPWLVEACYVAYWVYFLVSAASGLVVQCTVRSLPRHLVHVGPSECLEVFPLMLLGSIGGLLAPHLAEIDPSRALTVVIFSYIMQGLGFFMGYLKLSLWMLRHITLARAPSKTLLTYAIACGPPGFTALACINLGNAALKIFPETNFMAGFDGGSMDPHLVAQVFVMIGVWWSLLLMGMCCWVLFIHSRWFFLTLNEMRQLGFMAKFEMSWWAMTFPLSGFISTCGRFGEYFPSRAFGVVNIILTCFVACMWCVNITGTTTLLWNGILPGAPVEE
ncbi:voltage-dependent anion channel-domain-containing protein [Mrakia frigida]|uniref:voltage-dependent anion channel-domain-containing protein n=1 Tax=Mrakia frigida TaxID=29902 RepID=UPI003FCC23C7